MMTEDGPSLNGGKQRGHISVIKILPHQMGLCLWVCVCECVREEERERQNGPKRFRFSGSVLAFPEECVTQQGARPKDRPQPQHLSSLQ